MWRVSSGVSVWMEIIFTDAVLHLHVTREPQSKIKMKRTAVCSESVHLNIRGCSRVHLLIKDWMFLTASDIGPRYRRTFTCHIILCVHVSNCQTDDFCCNSHFLLIFPHITHTCTNSNTCKHAQLPLLPPSLHKHITVWMRCSCSALWMFM